MTAADNNYYIIAAGFNLEGDDRIRPSAFMQWKGTNVCMDFYCECGAHCHLDGYFAYAVNCPHCGTTWEMPSIIYPRRLADDSTSIVRNLEPDFEKEMP